MQIVTAARELASEVLDDPVRFDIEPGMLQRRQTPP